MALTQSSLEEHGVRLRPPRAHQSLVLAILLAAAFLRLSGLDRYPLPVHQDELSDIYDGYCMATTGADRSGARWPALIRGMGPGDYHPPAYAYLAAIPGYVAGFSVRAGRVPAALAGILTVWLVYLTAYRLFDRRTALLALLFIALSPIHILYSRQAHQGVCLVPLCVISIVYLLVRLTSRLERPRSSNGLLIAGATGLVIGLSTNAYAGQRLTALLFGGMAVALIAWTVLVRHRDRRSGWALMGSLCIGSLAGAWPQLHALVTQTDHFLARAGSTVYPLHCGFQWWGGRIANNLALNLDPTYLFLSFGDYSLLSVARLNIASMPFLYVGLLAACALPHTRKNPAFLWIPLGVLFSLAPALITEGNPSSMRSSGVWALYPIVTALGVGVIARCLVTAGHRLQHLGRKSEGESTTCPAPNGLAVNYVFSHAPSGLVMIGVSLLIVGAGAKDVARYLNRTDLQGPAAQHHFVRIADWIRQHDANYERVYVDAQGMFGYLYLAALSDMSVAEYREAPREGTLKGLGWEDYTRFGRFYFGTLEQARDDRERSDSEREWVVIDDALATHVLGFNDGAARTAANAPSYSVP